MLLLCSKRENANLARSWQQLRQVLTQPGLSVTVWHQTLILRFASGCAPSGLTLLSGNMSEGTLKSVTDAPSAHPISLQRPGFSFKVRVSTLPVLRKCPMQVDSPIESRAREPAPA